MEGPGCYPVNVCCQGYAAVNVLGETRAGPRGHGTSTEGDRVVVVVARCITVTIRLNMDCLDVIVNEL